MKVIIAGAGNIGRYLSVDLARRNHNVTIIDTSDHALGMVPSDRVVKMRGDACSPKLLTRAGINEADVVVAATGDDEDNLVVSLLAKQEFAVPRVLARVNHPINEWLFDDNWGVDLAVSPPHLLTALVEEEVSTGDLVSLLKLQRGQVQLLEVRLDETSPAVDKRIEELDLPGDITLVAVVRGGHVVTCRGTTPLVAGDEVLALVNSDRIDQLHDILIGEKGGHVTVHQCPRCELRFSNESELESHLVSDHGVDPEDLPDPLHYPRRHDEEKDGSATAT